MTEAAGPPDLRTIAYADATDPRQELDIHEPVGAPRRTAVVFIHGGGWYGGTRDAFTNMARWSAGRGFPTASLGYRIEEDTDYADKVADLETGLAIVTDKLRPERLILVGSSAGAHLATALVLEQRTPQPVVGVLSINGPGSMADDHLGESGQARVRQLGLTDEHLALFGQPPSELTPAEWLFLLAEDEHYFLHPGVEVLAGALARQGHAVETVIEPDTKHGFAYARTPESHPEMFARLSRFFDRCEAI